MPVERLSSGGPWEEIVGSVVAAHLGADVANVTPVVGRGEVNQVCVVATTDGARFVVRSNERAELDRFRKEAWSIERAGRAGVVVAPVLASGQTGDRAWMLQPFLRGTPGDELPLRRRERVWRGIGEQLRRIHAVPVGGFGETLATMAAGGDARWRDYLAYNLGELNHRDPLLALGLLDRTAQARLRDLFERLAARRVRLGLSHGDLSLKNVVVEDGVVQVIDWGCAQGHLVPHYDLGVILSDSLSEHSKAFEELLEGYGLDGDAYRRDMRDDVIALRSLQAVDKVRWALDRNRARLPALATRLATELRAAV